MITDRHRHAMYDHRHMNIHRHTMYTERLQTHFLALVLLGKSTTKPPVKPALIDCCVISSTWQDKGLASLATGVWGQHLHKATCHWHDAKIHLLTNKVFQSENKAQNLRQRESLTLLHFTTIQLLCCGPLEDPTLAVLSLWRSKVPHRLTGWKDPNT